MESKEARVAAPKLPGMIKDVLSAMGLSSECSTIPGDEHTGWKKHRFLKGGKETPIPVLLMEHKAKPISDAKQQVSGMPYCIVIFHLKSRYVLFFKAGPHSTVFGIDGDDAAGQIQAVLSSSNFASQTGKPMAILAVRKMIQNIPTATKNFNNRGVFSTHYLKSRLLGEFDATADGLSALWKGDALLSLEALGWTDLEQGDDDGVYRSQSSPLATILVVEEGPDFGMQRSTGEAAPSYRAISELKNTPWVMLTDGATWRLYTSRVSASTTNYFEIALDAKREIVLRYMAVIFGAASYTSRNGKAPIDTIFDDGKNYVQELEDNLKDRILKRDGVFVDMVKGVLDHDMKRLYANDDLRDAKEVALKILYRIWFLLYAESRDLLPVKDKRYVPLSLTALRNGLDGMESNPDDCSCWRRVLDLFGGVRNGSPQHNLPQYSGGLFRHDPKIDGIMIRNRHFVRAMRGLFERGGESVDYASLGVRHLGNIYETLMEFEVRQADRHIMLLEDKNGTREVASKAESTYTYRKNDLYIVSKAGYVSRKSSGSYYTPEKVVTFLVRRGLEPILEERQRHIADDLKRYEKSRARKDYDACMDRLLDIQVLDPAMGSGHFLVEALNQITGWATGMLKLHPSHPLLDEIEKDRKLIISTQKSLGVAINQGLLTHDVLLKRRVMKRCIFGADANPLAVELARVSLWLDSFAIGVPLTYLGHHVKAGDSTIGAWRSSIGDAKGRSLDDWMAATDKVGAIMERVSRSSDITIEQVRSSEDAHGEYERAMESHKAMLDVWTAAQIDPSIIPPKARKNIPGYIRRFTDGADGSDIQPARRRARELGTKYRFFHWELEMMDAFTDGRYGFDLVVGNPPWDKPKPSDDEFFTRYYPPYKAISTKSKKAAREKEILKDADIRKEYGEYLLSFRERSAFYKTYAMQGDGDRDMWQIMLERMFGLAGKGGTISVIIPSQVLSNTGSAHIRKRILDADIRQMYVFENRRKIFPIHSSYRFLLLTMRNASGQDAFEAGFYLHYLQSLESDHSESEKFHHISKGMIRKVSPDTLMIPEVGGRHLQVLEKMSTGQTLVSESHRGWDVALTSGFHKTADANLLKDGGRGWPVLEGRNIHQFNHNFARPEFVTSASAGLDREKRKKAYCGRHRKFYHSFRLAFRQISSPTNMRTIIAAVIPPQRFYVHSVYSVVLTRNGQFEQGGDYNRHTAYLCGVLNSTPFDYMARAKTQINVSTVIGTIPLPAMLQHYDEVAELAAKLSVGTNEFEGFAESLRVENVSLSPPERIHVTARLDALVAHSYGLTLDEYHVVLDSFKFEQNAALLEAETADLGDNKILRQFYGEVRRLAPKYYMDVGGGHS